MYVSQSVPVLGLYQMLGTVCVCVCVCVFSACLQVACPYIVLLPVCSDRVVLYMQKRPAIYAKETCYICKRDLSSPLGGMLYMPLGGKLYTDMSDAGRIGVFVDSFLC